MTDDMSQPFHTGLISCENAARRRSGFTLIECLVTLALVFVLMALFLPTIGTHHPHWRYQCPSNLKQLQFSWLVYANDNNDHLPLNRYNTPAPAWTENNAPIDATPTNLMRGTLFEYLKQPECYHCPADLSLVANASQPRFRSYSLSDWLNGSPHGIAATNLSQIKTPTPDKVFGFIDENEDSIASATDPSLWLQPEPGPGSNCRPVVTRVVV